MTTRKLHYKNILAEASTYVGEVGSVFFDPATNMLRIGDGVTPGGNALTLDIGLATHDDATYINNLLYQSQGTGFSTSTDSLHAISGKITANDLVQQGALNGISSGISNMASGTTLTAVQSSLGSSITSASNTIQSSLKGVGFVPGTDDLHNIRSAISTLQSDINSIKTHLGI
jgi:hypothetical protein